MVLTFITKGSLVSSRTSLRAESVDMVTLVLFITITTVFRAVNSVLSSLTLWIYWNNVMCAKHFNIKFILYDIWIYFFVKICLRSRKMSTLNFTILYHFVICLKKYITASSNIWYIHYFIGMFFFFFVNYFNVSPYLFSMSSTFPEFIYSFLKYVLNPVLLNINPLTINFQLYNILVYTVHNSIWRINVWTGIFETFLRHVVVSKLM